MKKIKFGLLLKFAIPISLVIILTSSLLSLFTMGVERFRAEAELKNKGYALAQNLAYNSEYGILSGNLDALNLLIKNLMEQEDVFYVHIFDSAGNILASGQKLKSSSGVINIETPVKTIRTRRTPEEVGLSSLTPSGVKEKEELIGNIKIGISLLRVRAMVNELFSVILGITLSVILAGILGVALLTKYLLINPLREFIGGTTRISKGDLAYQITLNSNDEIGELSASFNIMTSELKKAKDQLSSYAKDLEKKVAERTKELENTVAELRKTAAELEIARTSLEKKVVERTGELEREKASLEEKVRERTAELEERVKELEEFHDLAVGRELKMIELEKEIEKLKKEEKL